jgi:hypothetical protein
VRKSKCGGRGGTSVKSGRRTRRAASASTTDATGASRNAFASQRGDGMKRSFTTPSGIAS